MIVARPALRCAETPGRRAIDSPMPLSGSLPMSSADTDSTTWSEFFFFAVALWTLKPDSADEEEAARGAGHGVLLATIVAFFVAEMGDKTQVATVVLAAHYQPLWQVVAGTTLGMLLANVPVVWLGSRFAAKLPLKAARIAAAVLFAALGAWIVLR